MNWSTRFTLFTLILICGLFAALIAGETRGLAFTDLSNRSVSAITQSATGNMLLAALDGEQPGIFRSGDGGYSWEQIGRGPQAEVNTLAVHPLNKNILFAGTRVEANRDGGNLWYSADGGQTWDDMLFGLPANESGQSPQVSVVASSADHPNTMFMGTWGQGLYRFDVREGFMEQLGGSTLATLYVNDVVSLPNRPVYAVTTEGLMRVKGSQVEKITTPDGVVSMAVSATDPKTLYIGTVGYGVHRSTDGGQTWQPLNDGLGLQPGTILRVPALAVDSENPQHLAVTTAFGVGSQLVGDGLFESYDGGQSWTRLATINNEIIDDLTIEAGAIYVATANGLARYGEPAPAPEPTLWQRVQSLTSPTAVQLAILAVTLLVAVWALFVRQSWAAARVKQ